MVFLLFFLSLTAVLVLALWLGGPKAPPPMKSVLDPFRDVDFSNLPSSQSFPARDGTLLSYRHYPAEGSKAAGSVVLVHGSSARNHSVYPLALALSGAGWSVYTPDIRGHGDSGNRGKISYIGQLEDDLEDFITRLGLEGKKVLMGFSSGGGFVLRFAGRPKPDLFDAYILLSPFLHQDAATYRKNSGGWVGLGIPRIVALVMLNRLGITAFNGLPVVAFALAEKDKKFMTPEYSFALSTNFRPNNDYRSDIRNAKKPLIILAGQNDEVFHADKFAQEFALAGDKAHVTLIPELGHVGLTLDPRGIQAVAEALKCL